QVLELNGADPFTARLDDVFGAVGDLDIALGGNGADISRAQPTVVELLGTRLAVVRTCDPRPAYFDFADCFAIPRERVADVVDDTKLDSADDTAGAGTPIHLIGRAEIDRRRRMRDRGQRRGLGHPPRLHDAHAVLLLKVLHQRARHGRTTADDHAE